MEFRKLAFVVVGLGLGISGMGGQGWAGAPVPAVQGPPADLDDIYRSEIKESGSKISDFEFQLLDLERERKKKERLLQEADEERKAHPERQPSMDEKYQSFKASQRLAELKMETIMLESRKKDQERRITVFQQLRKEATTLEAVRARRQALAQQFKEIGEERRDAWAAWREASDRAAEEYRQRREEQEAQKENDSGAAEKTPEQEAEERQAAFREIEKKLAPEQERVDAVNERMQLHFTEVQIINGLLALDSPEEWLEQGAMNGGYPGVGQWGGFGSSLVGGMGGFGIILGGPVNEGGPGRLQSNRKVKRVRNSGPAGGGGGDSGSSGTAFIDQGQKGN